MNAGMLVTSTIDGAHPRWPDYPLLEGDLLVLEEDGTYAKEALPPFGESRCCGSRVTFATEVS